MEMIEVIKHIHGSRTCGRRQDLHLPAKVSDPVSGRNKYSKILGKLVVKLPFKCPCHQTLRKRQQPCVNVVLAAGGAGGLTQTPRNDASLTGAQERESPVKVFLPLPESIFCSSKSLYTFILKMNYVKDHSHLICIRFGFPQAPSRSVFQIW